MAVDRQTAVFRFGEFEVSERDLRVTVTRDGQQLAVEPKAFRVLLHLLRNPGRLIPKEELISAGWGETAVTDNSLTRNIALLRRLLGDDPREPRYIETVSTVGYRFICNVDVVGDVSGNGKVTDSANVPVVTDPEEATASETQSAPRATQKAGSSKELRGGAWSLRSRPFRIVFAACACCALLAGLGIYLLKPPPLRTEGFRFGPSGIDVNSPMWSPDGRAIVYAAKPAEDSQFQLYLRYLNSPVGIQLTHVPEDQTGRLVPLGWSTDRTHIIFAKAPNPFDSWFRIYSIPTVGGTTEFIMDHRLMTGFSNALSPDGKALVSFAHDDQLGTFRLYISDPLGTQPRPYLPEPFATKSFSNLPLLRFSPDGKKLLFIIEAPEVREAVWLLPFPPGSKPPRRLALPLPRFGAMPGFDWMPDSQHIVVSVATAQHLPHHLWMVDPEAGGVTALTGGTEIQASPHVAPDGKSLLFQRYVPKFSVVSVSVLDGAAKPIIDTERQESMPSWSADTAKMVWVSNRNGPYEIWLREADGSERPVVTGEDSPPGTDRVFIAPAISPDGERIIYERVDVSGAKHVEHLWLSSISGGPPLRLTNVEPDSEIAGSWSPDGDRFVYVQVKGGKWTLMIVKTSGNATPQVLKEGVEGWHGIPDWSPSGDWITYRDKNGWHLISPDGKTSKALGKIGNTTDFLAFSKDRKLLYGMHWGEPGPNMVRGILFSLDPVTLKEKTIKDLGRSFVPSANFGPSIRFSFAPDGKSFVYTIEQSHLDWWILQGLPQPGWRDRLRTFFRMDSQPER
jgi:Tol biopolymer transport system component/DNA-binding winged helix-turn-helix (wHTH) protein